MLMLKTTHDREIERLTRERDNAKRLSEKVFAANLRLTRDLVKANSRLAPFIAERKRGAGGKFLSTKGAVA